jgi:hypothetical protein
LLVQRIRLRLGDVTRVILKVAGASIETEAADTFIEAIPEEYPRCLTKVNAGRILLS